MEASNLLTPGEVAALAGTPKTVVEKALEQNVFAMARTPRSRKPKPARLLPLYAVALTVAAKTLGRRLTVGDKKFLARHLAELSPRELKTAEVEIASAVVIRVGMLTRAAVEGAERYLAARDMFVERREDVMGGRPVIRGTRITIDAVRGRLSSGDQIEGLMDDYPDVPREAFEAAFLYAQMHPQVGRPPVRSNL